VHVGRRLKTEICQYASDSVTSGTGHHDAFARLKVKYAPIDTFQSHTVFRFSNRSCTTPLLGVTFKTLNVLKPADFPTPRWRNTFLLFHLLLVRDFCLVFEIEVAEQLDYVRWLRSMVQLCGGLSDMDVVRTSSLHGKLKLTACGWSAVPTDVPFPPW